MCSFFSSPPTRFEGNALIWHLKSNVCASPSRAEARNTAPAPSPVSLTRSTTSLWPPWSPWIPCLRLTRRQVSPAAAGSAPACQWCDPPTRQRTALSVRPPFISACVFFVFFFKYGSSDLVVWMITPVEREAMTVKVASRHDLSTSWSDYNSNLWPQKNSIAAWTDALTITVRLIYFFYF